MWGVVIFKAIWGVSRWLFHGRWHRGCWWNLDWQVASSWVVCWGGCGRGWGRSMREWGRREGLWLQSGVCHALLSAFGKPNVNVGHCLWPQERRIERSPASLTFLPVGGCHLTSLGLSDASAGKRVKLITDQGSPKKCPTRETRCSGIKTVAKLKHQNSNLNHHQRLCSPWSPCPHTRSTSLPCCQSRVQHGHVYDYWMLCLEAGQLIYMTQMYKCNENNSISRLIPSSTFFVIVL